MDSEFTHSRYNGHCGVVKSCLEIFRFACDRGFTRLSVKPVVKGGLGSGRKQKAFERTDCRERGESVTSSCHQWVSAGHSRIVSKGSAVPKEEFNDIKKIPLFPSSAAAWMECCLMMSAVFVWPAHSSLAASSVLLLIRLLTGLHTVPWPPFLLPYTGWTYHWGCQGQVCGSRGMCIFIFKPIISF